MGDLIFVVVNLARHLGVDAETALRAANRKFETRFQQMEQSSDKPLGELSPATLESLWEGAKKALKQTR